MAKPLADCRIRIEFPGKQKPRNIGLFYNPVSRRIVMKIGRKKEEVTPSQLGQRLGKWIGDNIK